MTNNGMTVEAAREIIGNNIQTITTFMNYLNNGGIQLQLTEAASKHLFIPVTDAGTLLSGAAQDIAPDRGQPIVDAVIAAAASLEFIVRLARMVNELVLPRDIIPSEEVVNAALALFHDAMRMATVS